MKTDQINNLLAQYQEITFRTRNDLRIKSIDQAIDFVNERGFIHFWTIKGLRFPSLWAAVAGDRPVPNNHDDPGHITWSWKDQMVGKGVWYYGRQIRKKNSFISLEALPYFYALSPNYGEFEVDYLSQYQQGKLTAEAKAIYEALLFEGPLDTISLRKTARLSSSANAARFQRALDLLQIEMKIMPVGISQAGPWRYAFIFDLVPRHFPLLEDAARKISGIEAQTYLLLSYLRSIGMMDYKEIYKMFRWDKPLIDKLLTTIGANNLLALVETSVENKEILILQDILPKLDCQ